MFLKYNLRPILILESEFKRSRLQEAFSMPTSNGVEHGDLDTTSDGYKHIERFNRDMMDQFLDFQRRSQSSFIRFVKIQFLLHINYTERFTALDKLNLVKFAFCGLVFASNQISLLPRQPQIMTLASKMVKREPKIIILLAYSKSVTRSLENFFKVSTFKFLS